ncbi:HprK-related kinase A [Undibacterium terreum]|uniref:HprK-related kinase A n=1 Tax=Undibacterium terreum TaxID=1224302 RepID=UPI00227A25A0|nr:HprK-related kinase A [Undibacterium terreum]
MFLRIGPVTMAIRSTVPSVVEGVRLVYADYPLADDDFADFHVTLNPPRNLRRWLKPQAMFELDGVSPFKPLPFKQAFPMLEWGMNWCVSTHMHGYLMIHAAVMERDGHAAILPAPPGSGKSTLCATLVHKGWRLLSDELTLIRLADGEIIPLPRPVSLKNASIDIVQQYVPSAVLSPKVYDTLKGTVALMKPPADSLARIAETVKPAWIIFPKYEAGAATRLEAIPQSRAFMRVADNAFNYSLLGARGFEALAGLIDKSTAFDFNYSSLDEAIETFASLQTPAQAL